MRSNTAPSGKARERICALPGNEVAQVSEETDLPFVSFEVQLTSILTQSYYAFSECMRDPTGKRTREAQRWMGAFAKMALIYLQYQQTVRAHPHEEFEIEFCEPR